MNTIDTLMCKRGRHVLAHLKADQGDRFIEAKISITRQGVQTRETITFTSEDTRTDLGSGALDCACGNAYLFDPVEVFAQNGFDRNLIKIR
ncbi:MAG: hypothetical protein EOO27_04825 [Comamonadaceae bacterium]|nr:MAG: hypothetical protein EOO27_04825 [Comamonadaceae bacterium]